MARPSGIRWPEDLEAEIEKARVEDDRRNFTDEVIHLVKLGLKERAWEHAHLEKLYAARRPPIEPPLADMLAAADSAPKDPNSPGLANDTVRPPSRKRNKNAG